MLDGLQEILFTLRQNKLRTLLTAFGVFWGIFMLILLLGAGRGMQNGIFADFGTDVLDFIIVGPGDTSVAYNGMGLGRKIRLDQADIEAVRNQVSGVRLISGETFMQYGVTVTYGQEQQGATCTAFPRSFSSVKEDVPFTFGRKTNPLDVDEIRKVVVIGTNVAERLFAKGEDPVGQGRRGQGRRDEGRRRVPRQGQPRRRIPRTSSCRSRPRRRCTAAAGASTRSGCGPSPASTGSSWRRRSSSW